MIKYAVIIFLSLIPVKDERISYVETLLSLDNCECANSIEIAQTSQFGIVVDELKCLLDQSNIEYSDSCDIILKSFCWYVKGKFPPITEIGTADSIISISEDGLKSISFYLTNDGTFNIVYIENFEEDQMEYEFSIGYYFVKENDKIALEKVIMAN